MAREIYRLYNGEVILEYDPVHHTYIVNGKPVLSVTTIVSILDKSEALMNWAVNKVKEFLEAQLVVGKVYDELEKQELLIEAAQAHKKHSRRAKDIGTFVHEWIQKYIESKIKNLPPPPLPLNIYIRKSVEAFLKWEKENKIQFLETERKIYSKAYNYAGTLDAEAVANNKIFIIDFKTSNAIHPEYFLQTSAYTQARSEESGLKYEDPWVIKIGKDGTLEAQQMKNWERNFEAFLSCLKLYRWRTEDVKIHFQNFKRNNHNNIYKPEDYQKNNHILHQENNNFNQPIP